MTRPILSQLHEIDRLVERCPRILLALDFDGTLCPIASSPDRVRVPAENILLLRQLHDTGRVLTAIISGRAIEDVMSRLDLPVIFAGNHGLEIRGPELEFHHAQAAGCDTLLLEACRVLELTVERWPGAWIENKRLAATVHYRNVRERDEHTLVLAVRACMARFGAVFGLRAGHKALEIHPRVEWNKGAALQHIREQMDATGAGCICIGDDRTDESMFSSLAGEITVRVGKQVRTAAEYHVASPDEVTALLAHLLRTLQSGAVPLAACG